MGKVSTNFKTPRQRWFFREWRKHRGYTQEELAHRVGVTTSSISQLETGKQGFSADTLVALAEVLECTVADLLTRDPAVPGDPMRIWARIRDENKQQALRILETFADDGEETAA